DALQEPLTATRGTIPRMAPHLSLQLKKMGQAKVQSHIDFNTQLKIEKITADYTHGLKLLNINNAAVVVIDNTTHQVISYVGSANFFDTTDAGQVNGATAIRQPGSTLKPLLYGLCIDAGLITPKMTIGDVAVNYQGYVPENYDQRFNGFVSMEYALMHSLNIPAVKMMNQLGKERMINALSAAGCKQIEKDRQKLGLSLILGGCGASLLELTGMFSALACNGQFTAPIFCQNEAAKAPVQILSPPAAFMISDVLSQINRPDFPINWQATEHLPKIAWKTGTSYGRRDAWSIGYNKHFTVGVWVGNFSGQGIPELSGAQTATPLLFKVFNTIDYNSNYDWFTPPPGCDLRTVCAETGMPPAEFCTNFVSDYFMPLTSPNLACNNRQQMLVSADEKISYCVECAPATGLKKKWFGMLAPEMQAYFEQHHLIYDKIPAHNTACKKLFYENGPIIKSPDAGGQYYISKTAPEPILLQCQTPADVSKVFWYVNNQYYKAALPTEKVFFMPTEGPQKISCTDDKGRNRDVKCMVKFIDF
ncbi:MAG: penicillin-binding protein 1C, partial [Bacteroidetes bacterium]